MFLLRYLFAVYHTKIPNILAVIQVVSEERRERKHWEQLQPQWANQISNGDTTQLTEASRRI